MYSFFFIFSLSFINPLTHTFTFHLSLPPTHPLTLTHSSSHLSTDIDAVVVVDTLGRYIARVLVTSPLGLTFCSKQHLVFVGSKKGPNNQGAVYGIDPITRTIVKTFVLPPQALASGQGLDHPAGLTIHGNILYVAEQSSNAVFTFDITTTQFIRQIIDLNNIPTLGESNGEVIEQLTLS